MAGNARGWLAARERVAVLLGHDSSALVEIAKGSSTAWIHRPTLVSAFREWAGNYQIADGAKHFATARFTYSDTIPAFRATLLAISIYVAHRSDTLDWITLVLPDGSAASGFSLLKRPAVWPACSDANLVDAFEGFVEVAGSEQNLPRLASDFLLTHHGGNDSLSVGALASALGARKANRA